MSMSTKKLKARSKTATCPAAADVVREMAAPYLSPGERRAESKALRDAVPRTSHGGWKEPRCRRGPVELPNLTWVCTRSERT